MDRFPRNPEIGLARRVGLNRKHIPQRLLSIIGGKPIQNHEPALATKPLTPLKMNGDIQGGGCDPITAPPETSDDEGVVHPAVDRGKELISDSDDQPIRGDIKPTKFGKENHSPISQASGMRRNTRGAARPSERDSILPSSSQSEETASSSSKRSRGEGGNKASSHLVDSFGFINKRRKIRAPGRSSAKVQGYGRPSQRSSQKSAPRSSAPQRDG